MTLSAFSAILMYTWPRDGASVITPCPHTVHWPRYDAAACQYLTVTQIRDAWPCYQSICTLCQQRTQIWASLEHYMAGGWGQQGGSA